MSSVSIAREAAFQVLMAVAHGSSHADELLRSEAIDALPMADRNLTTTLVMGVLRWQIRLDHALHSLLARPNAKLDLEVQIALRLGAFQLLYLDRIPAHAAIDESVELAKRNGHNFASGMVNAVLRKLSTAPRPFLAENSAAELALAQAHPLWLVERWVNFYGMEMTRNICRHGQKQPLLTLRLHDPAIAHEIAAASVDLRPSGLLNLAFSLVSGDLATTPAWHQGLVRIQDEGSQLIAEVAAHVCGRSPRTILDCCAAPGGKTLILAQRNPKAQILACESSPPRFAALQERLAPIGGRIHCRHVDATTLASEGDEGKVPSKVPSHDPAFDLALADVPCSGTGTLGRNPEIRHRLCIDDLSRQAERQHLLLAAALRSVRKGGRVAYSTCSLEPEENEIVLESVLDATTNAHLVPASLVPLGPCLKTLLDEGILTASGFESLVDSLTPEGTLRLFPGRYQTDGFFLAILERTA